MKKRLHHFIVCVVVLLFASTTAYGDPGKGKAGKSYKDRGKKERKESHKHGKTYFHDHGYTRLSIPPGHYPAPGECRIWFPDRPPGRQPPPGNCGSVPPGAWLIRHPRHHLDRVQVFVYEPLRPSRLMVVGEFEISSGLFMRVLLER